MPRRRDTGLRYVEQYGRWWFVARDYVQDHGKHDIAAEYEAQLTEQAFRNGWARLEGRPAECTWHDLADEAVDWSAYDGMTEATRRNTFALRMSIDVHRPLERLLREEEQHDRDTRRRWAATAAQRGLGPRQAHAAQAQDETP
jgi:hypothetical protein